MLYKSHLLTLETIGYSWIHICCDEYWFMGPRGRFTHGLLYWIVGTGYVLRVELPVQRRLCPIFLRDVGSPGIHERFCGLMGSQRTPGIWSATMTLVSISRNCWATAQIVLQYSSLYCKRKGTGVQKCIAIQKLYCDQGG